MEKKIHRPLTVFLGKLKRINVTLYLVKKYFLAQMILEKFQSKLIPFYKAVNERWLWLFAVNGIIRFGLFSILYCLFLFISPGVQNSSQSEKFDKVDNFSCKTKNWKMMTNSNKKGPKCHCASLCVLQVSLFKYRQIDVFKKMFRRL